MPTVNDIYPITLQLAKRESSLYPRVWIYISSQEIGQSPKDLNHVARGYYYNEFIPSTSGYYYLQTVVFTDAGYSVTSNSYGADGELIKVDSIEDNIVWISSQQFASSSIITHGDNYWRSSNISELQDNLSYISGIVFPSGDIIAHGDNNWSTGAGGGGGSDFISSQLNFISSQIIGISSQLDGIETHGDSNWATAVGFATAADLAELESEMDYVSSQVFPSGDIITHGDSNWITAVGFSTHSAADVDTTLSSSHGSGDWEGVGGSAYLSSQLAAISSNTVELGKDTDYISSQIYPSAAIIDHGDNNWITAVGFSTHNASDIWSVATRELTAGTRDDTIDWISSQQWNSGSIITHGDIYWRSSNINNIPTDIDTELTSSHGAGSWEGVGGSGFLSSQLSAISSNIVELGKDTDYISGNSFPSSAIILHGDNYWTTGVGGGSAGSEFISSQLNHISSQIFGISSQVKGIESYGDTNWATAVGFATPSDFDELESEMDYVSSQVGDIFASGDIIVHGDNNWSTGTGGGSAGSIFISTQLNYISSQVADVFPSAAIIVHGDNNWTAAAADLSPQVNYISGIVNWASSNNLWFQSGSIITHGDANWSAAGGTATQNMVSYISTQTTWLSSQTTWISSNLEAYGGGGGKSYAVYTRGKSPWTHKQRDDLIENVSKIIKNINKLEKSTNKKHKDEIKTIEESKDEIILQIDRLTEKLNLIKKNIKNSDKNYSEATKIIDDSIDELKNMSKEIMEKTNEKEFEKLDTKINKMMQMVITTLDDESLEKFLRNFEIDEE